MLGFICDKCKTAADIPNGNSPVVRIVKKRTHDECKGSTWCDCQHRVGAKTV